MGRAAGLTLLAAALLAAALPAAAHPPATASAVAAAATPASLPGGPAHCRFAPPAGWDARQVRWTGDCRAGFAQGLGALRWLEGQRVRQLFYGRLDKGQPVLGVVELNGGFRAGQFALGRVLPDSERNTLIAAFDAAAAAAREVAQRYQAGGNPASARFYRQKATQLAQQID